MNEASGSKKNQIHKVEKHSSPRNDTSGTNYDWDKEPLDISDMDISDLNVEKKNPSASGSQSTSGKEEAIKKLKTTEQIKSLIGSYGTNGLYIVKLKRVYEALYEEPIDKDILLALIIKGQVEIIDEKLAMKDKSFHKPLSPI